MHRCGRCYEATKSQLVTVRETFVAFFLLLFDFFPFTRLCRGVLPPTDSSDQLCVRVCLLTWPDARSKNPSARIYLISLLYTETGSPNRLSVLGDCGYTSPSSPTPNQIRFVQWIIQYARKRQRQIIPTFPC